MHFLSALHCFVACFYAGASELWEFGILCSDGHLTNQHHDGNRLKSHWSKWPRAQIASTPNVLSGNSAKIVLCGPCVILFTVFAPSPILCLHRIQASLKTSQLIPWTWLPDYIIGQRSVSLRWPVAAVHFETV